MPVKIVIKNRMMNSEREREKSKHRKTERRPLPGTYTVLTQCKKVTKK